MINQYFLEIFEAVPRQGPGSKEETQKAYLYLQDVPKEPAILDIGCGKGKQTFDLLDKTDGHITALDMHIPFLKELNAQIQDKQLQHRISTVVGNMAELPFLEEQFDLIWSEGSLYIMGYQQALEELKRYIKPSGYLVFTDCVWLNKNPPKELVDFWRSEELELPQISSILEKAQSEYYSVVNHFTLTERAWKEEFYDHIETALFEAKNKYNGISEAEETFNSIELEIEMYNKHNEYFGYEFFILKKIGS